MIPVVKEEKVLICVQGFDVLKKKKLDFVFFLNLNQQNDVVLIVVDLESNRLKVERRRHNHVLSHQRLSFVFFLKKNTMFDHQFSLSYVAK